ncbi:putative ABC transport system permease protein [Altererythrobacter atlanticus]|uniref:Macrolide export ATP-binding/permease protein MacB n=1 Tax=Croceibacterium atlanticum TaxID=1267766 RepID=A0A0F7KWZ9_9SPHN|nr:ABC transporter permease [Croceibacterium atlanticum]AKH44199.1 Macrolide export ATP-binding/permease protein MacB [Croceibacterium atlanticum]MBB5732510.1 putative ABC transport system permease protein [Croceibacterium atlanticum]
MFGATLLLAFREIRRHLLRSFLTTLGIVIGVAAVITMVTLGRGVTASVQEDISSLGSNVFIVFPVRTDRGPGRPFDGDDVEAVASQIAGVEEAAGSVSANATAIYNGQNWSTSVQGANNAFLRGQSIEVDAGRTFTETEETAGKSVCLIGTKVRAAIFPISSSPLGENLRLGDVSCTVIGVLKERGQGASINNQDSDDVVIMPLKTVQRRFTGSTDLQYFIVKYSSAYSSTGIQNALIDLLRERRVLQGGQDNDFDIIDTAQVNDAISSATGALTAMVAAIAGISLMVGGIGIMNIMLVSVTERTREIGIRLAIGALAREVQLQFLTEAVVLCCFGGMIGIGLAFVLSISLAQVLDVPYVFDPAVNAISFLFSALMGIAFGYYPARRASRLDPIDALRHE